MLFIVVKFFTFLHLHNVPCMSFFCSNVLQHFGALWFPVTSATVASVRCWFWRRFPPDVLVYMLMSVSGAQLGGKDGTRVQRCVIYGRIGEDFLVLSARVSQIQWPQDPQAPASEVPDTQMGQIVSLSASRKEKANSLIWSPLMECF